MYRFDFHDVVILQPTREMSVTDQQLDVLRRRREQLEGEMNAVDRETEV